jgi:hypothetical protein
VKQADRTKASKSVCTSTVVASSDPLSPNASTSSENAEEDPDIPEPADKGDIQTAHSSD